MNIEQLNPLAQELNSLGLPEKIESDILKTNGKFIIDILNDYLDLLEKNGYIKQFLTFKVDNKHHKDYGPNFHVILSTEFNVCILYDKEAIYEYKSRKMHNPPIITKR